MISSSVNHVKIYNCSWTGPVISLGEKTGGWQIVTSGAKIQTGRKKVAVVLNDRPYKEMTIKSVYTKFDRGGSESPFLLVCYYEFKLFPANISRSEGPGQEGNFPSFLHSQSIVSIVIVGLITPSVVTADTPGN